ncbi:MAG: nitrilase [Marinovum sp.]|nr:nitrilase [Marinovum sp.]
MPRPLSIACLQTRPMPSIGQAIDEATPLAEQAVRAGAEFLFLPEYCGGLKSEGSTLTPPHATEAEHPFLAAFRDFAAQHNVWIMIGSIAVSGHDGKILNRGYILDQQGNIHSHYDKIHLFDVQISPTEVYRESTRVTAGNAMSLVQTPYAQLGHTICYDLRFPKLYRDLAQAGAEVLCTPAAFTKKTGEAHWHILNRARAIENGCFMISACAIGEIAGGGASYGHSLVINPWGEIIADGGDTPGVVFATIDLDEVAEARGRIPSLSHDRNYKITSVKERGIA